MPPFIFRCIENIITLQEKKFKIYIFFLYGYRASVMYKRSLEMLSRDDDIIIIRFFVFIIILIHHILL